MYKMKKKANIFYNIMMTVVVFVSIAAMLGSVKEVASDARSVDNLNCTSPSLTTGENMTCIGVDLFPFVFGFMGFAAAISYIAYKKKKRE